MTQFALPIEQGIRNYSFIVNLDEEAFEVSLYYNVRDEAFYIDVFEDDGTAIIQGRRLSGNTSPLLGISLENRPPGELIIADSQLPTTDPGPDDMGERHELLYFDAEEILELIS